MSYRKRHVKSKISKLRPRKRFYKKPVFWYAVLFLVFVLAVFYFLFFFPAIQISDIFVSGNEKVKTQDIENIILNNIEKNILSLGSWQVKSKSIFLASPSKIEKEILGKFPEIESVLVQKKLFKTIKIEIKERAAAAIFCYSEISSDCYFIDQNGIIFELANDVSGKMIILRKFFGENVFVGEKALQENIISAVLKADKILKDNFQVDVKEALITTPIRMDLKTAENWQVYFDLDSDLDLQITKMNLLLKNEVSESARKTLQYIDLRFKDRAYYK